MGIEDDPRLGLSITSREDLTYEAPNLVSFEVVEDVLTTTPSSASHVRRTFAKRVRCTSTSTAHTPVLQEIYLGA